MVSTYSELPTYITVRTYGRILDFSFGFGSFSFQIWPQDPFEEVRFEKWCRTNLKSAPETNYNVIS